jgi:NADPH-dependent 2,4-dienoyl-CoA reductase/sulfur reductase-like enzyme
MIDVVIVGAGPYGLSIAAHLQERGVAYRIFGQPMLTWQKLPRGTYLKSLGYATDVYTPGRQQNFTTYCRERNLESVEPCAMSDFAQFGMWLQSWAVPNLETAEISQITRVDNEFAVTTTDHETFIARKVIIAVGLTHFSHIPKEFKGLSSAQVSHTSEHSSFERFAGQDVCVLGAGASALDCAAKLAEAGARPQLLVRGSWFGFSWKTPATRKLWDKIRRPNSVLGFGLRSWIFEKLPWFCHYLPDAWRIRLHQTNYGPLGGWWLRDQVEGKIPARTQCKVVGAELRGDRLALTVQEDGQGSSEILCDHVIAGTGYDINVDRLPFLDDDIKARVRRLENAPALSRHFESSVPGLYFVGVASSLSFGPLFRFVAGAQYTSRVLSNVLARGRRCSLPRPQTMGSPVETPR